MRVEPKNEAEAEGMYHSACARAFKERPMDEDEFAQEQEIRRMREKQPSMLDIVKDNVTKFSFLRSGFAFYTIVVNGLRYMYPVELADLQNASVFAEMKAITMMRYIRKAIENGTFVREGR